MQAGFSLGISTIIAMTRNKSYTEEVEKMVSACLDEHESIKKGKELANYLSKRMEECERDAQKDDLLIIYISPQENSKDNNSYNESFIMASLLYLLFRFKFIKVKFIASSIPPPKVKRNEFQIKVSITEKLDNRFGKSFYEKIEEMVRQSYMQVNDLSMHFQEIFFTCHSQNIDQEPVQKQLQIIRKRQDCYKFIYKFYDHLQDILSDRKVFVTKNTLDFGNLNEQCICLPEIDNEFVGSEVCMKKIIGLQRKMHSNILVIKALLESYIQPYFAQENEEISEAESQEYQQFEEYDRQLGFYAPFKGNPFEYLSRFFLSLSYSPDFKSINDLLTKIPNITHFKIVKEHDNIIVPDINQLIGTIIKHNKLIELFWLTNMQVASVSAPILEQLYVECPYLCEFQISIHFRFLIEETYTSTSAEEKQFKDNERESQIILNALRLRKISLYHNIQMSKLLIKKGYNFNSIIEVIDCIEPFCF